MDSTRSINSKDIAKYYKKGQTDVRLLVTAYNHILTKVIAKTTMPVSYTKEGLKLAGFSEEEYENSK